MTSFYEKGIEDEGKDTKNIFADTAQLFQREAEGIEKKSDNFWIVLESCRLLEEVNWQMFLQLCKGKKKVRILI